MYRKEFLKHPVYYNIRVIHINFHNSLDREGVVKVLGQVRVASFIKDISIFRISSILLDLRNSLLDFILIFESRKKNIILMVTFQFERNWDYQCSRTGDDSEWKRQKTSWWIYLSRTRYNYNRKMSTAGQFIPPMVIFAIILKCT